MAKTAYKEQLIEKISYLSSNQSVSYREILKINDKKIKFLIKSDSYRIQCYAKAYVLKNDEWVEVYSVPYSEMDTKEGLIHHNNYSKEPQHAVLEFMRDRGRLWALTKEVLF